MTDPQDFDPTRYAADALAGAGISASADVEDPRALVNRAVAIVTRSAPPGWRSLHGVFSMAGGEEIAKAVAIAPESAVSVPVPVSAAELIRQHRDATIGARGPWLRLLFDLDEGGAVDVSFDYGDAEIPADQLLSAEAYLRDFETYPRPDAPLWLLAHMGNEGQQLRSAAQARDSGPTRAATRRADDEIPALPELWARMAVLAAVCRGTGAPVGPRIDPAFSVHVGERGGCTVARLPGGRAVLSGGRSDSELLTAAYKGALPWPDLYDGAPWWLQNLYLDPRATRGMLSFCYWWDGKGWYRSVPAGSPPVGIDNRPWQPKDEITGGMPGVWTLETTAGVVANVLKHIGVELTDRNHYAAVNLVRAAEFGVASQRYLDRLFIDGVPTAFDMAEALAQLDAAGVLLPEHPQIDAEEAKNLVADYCRANNVDPQDFPVAQLAAARMDAGWQLFVPVEPGEIAIGRAFFLAADDGVVEKASTSIPPDEVALIFARRFAARVRGRAGG